MTKRSQHLENMHAMCQQEVEELQENLSRFSRDLTNTTRLMKERYEKDPQCLVNVVSCHKFMSQLTATTNFLRNVSTHLQFNDLNKWLSCKDLDRVLDEWQYGKFDAEIDIRSMNSDDDGVFGRRSIKDINAIDSSNSAVTIYQDGSQNRRVHLHSLDHKHEALTISSSLSPLPLTLDVKQKDLSDFVDGYEFTAFITYVGDFTDNIFYVNTQEFKLLANIKPLDSYDATAPLPINVIFGYSNNDPKHIMRAIVESEGDKHALLIDFGEVVAINKNCKCFKIETRYHDIPAQAIRCKLLGVNNFDDDDLLREATLDFSSVLEKYYFQMVQLKVIRTCERTLYVQMYHMDLPSPRTEKKIKYPKTNPFRDEFDPDDIMVNGSNEPQLSMNDLSIEKLSLEAVFELDNYKPITHGTMADTNNNNNTTKIVNNDIISITVTYVVDVRTFYAQIEHKCEEQRFPLYWRDDELTLLQKFMKNPKLGDVLLAQFFIDQFWYRARIIGIDSDKQLYKVFFIDYGNRCDVPLSCLAYGTATQMEEPDRAVLFQIAGVTETANIDDHERREKAAHSLLVIILNQTFTVKVLCKKNNIINVIFIDPEFVEVPMQLMARGYVQIEESLIFNQ